MPFVKKTYTDKELIRGCIRNNRRHQERLYKRYFGMALSCILPDVKDKEKALIIVNQGFLRVFQNIEQLQDPKAIGAWIKTIMIRAKADEFRKQKRYLETIVLDMPQVRQAEESSMHELYFRDIVHLLDKLPPASAEVFRLYAIEGWKHKEIAEEMNISIGTSKWHLSAARKKLQTLIVTYYDAQKSVG